MVHMRANLINERWPTRTHTDPGVKGGFKWSSQHLFHATSLPKVSLLNDPPQAGVRRT